MFGLGMGEIILIAVLALLFVGPDKLPQTARSIGKGIRDFRKQTRDLQETIEMDSHIGGAVRELRSALRGDPEPPAPKPGPGKALGPASAVDAKSAAGAASPGAATAGAPAIPGAPAGPTAPAGPGAAPPVTGARSAPPPTPHGPGAKPAAPATDAPAPRSDGLPSLRRPAGNVARGADIATPPKGEDGAHG